MGFSVGVFKPIETGVEDIPVDAKLLLERVQRYNPKFKDFTPFDITAYTFRLPSAPFCASRDIDIDKIINKYNRTVSANYGMSYSISNVLKDAKIENIKRWLPECIPVSYGERRGRDKRV